jgi:hypothetical protein
MRNLEFPPELSVVRWRECIRCVFVCDALANGVFKNNPLSFENLDPNKFEIFLVSPDL